MGRKKAARGGLARAASEKALRRGVNAPEVQIDMHSTRTHVWGGLSILTVVL